MGNDKRLGEAELEIMEAFWDSGSPLSASRVGRILAGRRNWKMSTLMTSLSRLCAKGFLSCDRSGEVNMYSAAIPRSRYKVPAAVSFLEKMYGNSVLSLVSALYDGEKLGKEDIAELKKYIEELEKNA